LDRNTNVTRVEIGPSTFIRQDHEFVQTGDKPNKMIILPERHYCVIENPIIMEKGKPVQDKYGQY
jgi:major vault protein